MKARIFQQCGVVLMLALIPFFGGCDQGQAQSAPTDVAISQPPASVTATDTNQPPPGDTDQDLADAPGKIISTPDTGSTNTSNNPQLNDFVKLVRAGVGESVLMAYVANSPTAFNLSSDDILYLNDLGAPETVVTAMLQRDQQSKSNSTAAATATAPEPPPAEANPTPPPPPTAPEPEPYTDQATMAQAPEAMTPTPPPDVEQDVQQAPNTSYSYFYDSLSPYGNWINIQGYGPCWQPTAVAINPGWQPYCDHGHWAYTDCGWCWVSDYSWGWAPFHYGRWFHNNNWGWCWAPDTVWGPAWVSWRYSDSFCGWAPLPPSACYRPGFGFTYFGQSVGFSFAFGLTANRFVFVPMDHFHDPAPSHFRVSHREVTRIYNTTTINTQIIRGNNHTLINRGVPVDRVAAASHTEIHPIHVRADADEPRGPQLGRDGRSISVYRPTLPTPSTAAATTRVGEGVQPNPHFDLRTRINQPSTARNPMMHATPGHRPDISNPTAAGPSASPSPDNHFSQPNTEKPNSLILRGPDRPDRATPSRGGSSAQTVPQSPTRGQGFQPQTPAQPIAPDNHRSFAPAPPQPAQTAPNLPAPSFNRPLNDFSSPADPRANDAEQQRQKALLQQQQIQQQQQNRRDLLQQQQQQRELQQRQQPVIQAPRQDPPRVFQAPSGTPRMNDNPSYPVIRSEPAAQPRVFESRPAPEVRSAPPQQYSAPAQSHQDNSSSQGRSSGNSGGGVGNGVNGGGGGHH